MIKVGEQFQWARSCIIDAMAPVALRTSGDEAPSSKVFGSRCPLPPWQFELTKVYKWVCTTPQSSLLHYLYQTDPSWPHETEALKLVWQYAQSQLELPKDKETKLSILCWMALQNYRHALFHGKPAHKVKRVIEVSQVSEHNWRRDWLPFWRVFHESVLLLETEGLKLVEVELRTNDDLFAY